MWEVERSMIKSPIKRVLRRRPPLAGALLRVAQRLRLAATVAVLVLGVGGSRGGRAAETGPKVRTQAGEVRVLAPGEVLRSRMEAGAKHAYGLALELGEFTQIAVAQQGVDVGVRLFAPDGSLLIDMDSPNGFYGLERVSVVARVGGSYRVEVYSDSSYPPGDYELTVEGPRAASASDERRVTAERVFIEAQQLRVAAAQAAPAEVGEKYEATIGKYAEALGLWRELGDLRWQGYSLLSIGRSYRALRQIGPALEHLSQARERLHEAQDVSGEAFVLNEVGATQRDLGDPLRALESYDDALKLRVVNNDLWGQAQLYNNIGLTHSNMGSQLKAIENLERAISIWHGMGGQRRLEMNAVVNAAKAYVEMGELDAAFERYRTVLNFCETEDRTTNLKPFALNGLGLVYDTWADSEQARANYQQALELFRSAKFPRGEADVLDNLGMAHAFLDDATRALDYFREALVIRQRLTEPKNWAMTLSNVGYAETLLGDNQEALRHLELALPLSEQSRDRRFQAYTLVRTGMAYVATGDPRKALEVYERALAIQSAADFQDRRGQAITLDKIGEALALLGEETQALGKYGQALERWKGVGDRQGEALSLYGIARVEFARNNLANARDRVEEAIDIVESLRYKVSGRQLRMTYFAAKQDFYALDIDVRMRLYELTGSAADMEAALWASERARARNLNDLLSEARANPHKGMSAEEAKAYRRLEDKIGEMRQTSFRLRSLGKKEDGAVVEQKLAAYMGEQEELQARAAKGGGNKAGAGQGQPLKPREIQQLLDPDTVLLQYSLGESRSHLWAVTRAGIEYYSLAGRAELENAAEQFRQGLTAPERIRAGESVEESLARQRGACELYRRSAPELSRLVLGPVWPRLGNKRLVIVADGALQYIPFEALPVPRAAVADCSASDAADLPLLLKQNEVVYQPSASTLALLRGRAPRGGASRTVAVLADPVFDDKDERVHLPPGARPVAAARRSPSGERLTRSLRDLGDLGDVDFTLPKLEYSLREATAITSVAPRGSMMAVGFKANRATLTSLAPRRFSIVHFATHGLLNDRHPELSGIVLSMVNERGGPEDGYLTLRDIYNLDLPADLVVLSACRTGIGKQVRGEGLQGLTRGFMYAGSPRVVASLWRVDDAATAELMKHFYRHMLGKDRMPAAAALQKAKLEMLSAGSAPYFWAGFVLQGDWK
jgi:CHAT domain-containing protein/tetratricopeptide (TPR) repeat protein